MSCYFEWKLGARGSHNCSRIFGVVFTSEQLLITTLTSTDTRAPQTARKRLPYGREAIYNASH